MRLERIGRIAVVGISVAALSGCPPKKEDVPGRVAAKASLASNTIPGGKLPPGWENKNSAEMRVIVDSISWTEPVGGERTCADSHECKKVRATISANTAARLITPQNAGTTGAIIARMELDGPYATAMYKLVPGAFRYYVVVFASAGGGDMGWKMIQVANHGNSAIKEIGTGTFRNCKHTPNPGAPAAASWRGCDSLVKPAMMQRVDSGGEGGGDQPGWVSCADGCCTVSADQVATAALKGVLASAVSSGKKNRTARN